MKLPEASDRLDSWKEIAAFLGRTVRTVQRWEKTAGLPVRRGGPGLRSSVVASKMELAEWWEQRSQNVVDAEEPSEALETFSPPPLTQRHSARWLSLIALGLLGGGLFLWVSRPLSSTPSVRSVGRFLTGSTSEAQALTIVPLPSAPGGAVIPREGDQFYVSLPDEGVVATVDVGQQAIVDRTAIHGVPGELLLSPDEATLYVTQDSGVTAIDRQSRKTRFIATGAPVAHLATSSDGYRLWLTLARAGLKILDVSRWQLSSVSTVGCPMYLAPPIIGHHLFVSYQCGGPGGRGGHDAVEILDEPSGRSLIARHGPPLVGSRLAVSPDGLYLWADIHDACMAPQYDHEGCVSRGPGVHVLRASTLERLATFALPSRIAETMLAFVPDGSRVVVAAQGVHVINSQLGHPVESLRMEQSPLLALRSDGRRLAIGSKTTIVVFTPDSGSDARAVAGAVTYWSGDGTANDVAGGTHGSADRVEFAPGRLGQAFAFAGTSEVEFGERIDVDLPYRPSTYMAWIKPSRVGDPMSVLSRASFVGWDLRLDADARLRFCLARATAELDCPDGGLVTGSSLEPNTWRHVAVVRDSGSLRMFIDGQLEAQTSLVGYAAPPSANYDEAPVMRLGAGRAKGFEFHGLIDEVVMFGRALDGDEIARVMQATVFKTHTKTTNATHPDAPEP